MVPHSLLPSLGILSNVFLRNQKWMRIGRRYIHDTIHVRNPYDLEPESDEEEAEDGIGRENMEVLQNDDG